MSGKMKKKLYRTVFIFPAIIGLAVSSGCQSLAGTVGLATEQYVDEKVAEVESRLAPRIDANRSKLEEYAVTADKLEELIGSVASAVRTTDELKQLAVVLEERLNNLPEETIRQLVDVLQQYLDEK